MMPIKLQFDHQRSKNEKMKNKQEKSQMKVSGDANTAKPVRWDSMEHVRPDCEYWNDSTRFQKTRLFFFYHNTNHYSYEVDSNLL